MNGIDTKQMESAALATLQRALEKYSENQKISYEDALFVFSHSNTYKELFDFDSLLWTQGPDYLIAVYEKEISELDAGHSYRDPGQPLL